MSSGSPEVRSRARRAAAEPEELELKYSIENAPALEAWLDATFPPLPDQPWQTHSITDRYFDTAEGALSAAGYGARLRRVGRKTTLTLKSDIEVGGALHRRLELEGPAKQALDPDGWPQSDARDRLLALGGGRLVERVVISQRRRERLLTVGGAELVASIDTGIVRAAGAAVGRLAQFEIEYVRGRRAALDRVASTVEKSGLGLPEPRSKLAVALEMAEAAGHLATNDLFAEAGRKVLRRHVLRMLDREVGARAGDELALKQMRVATRRMRATWRVFEDGYKRSVERRYVGQLRRVGRALGEVRDLEVLLASLPAADREGQLAEHWRTRRKASFEALGTMLDSRRYARFVDEMLEFTAMPGAGVAKRGSASTVADMAPPALKAALDRVRAAGAAAVGTDDVMSWHALRIESRRLRYSIESFADVLEKKQSRELIRRVTRIQDHLGAMNDAAVAISDVSLWLADGTARGELHGSAELVAYVATREQEIVSLRESFGRPWRGVSGVTFQRLLERALAPLTNR